MYVLSKHFLDASAKTSYRESSKEIERVTKALSEKYEMDPIEAVPKVKRMTAKEAMSEQEDIQIDEIAETVYARGAVRR